jgi:hypothetical protein
VRVSFCVGDEGCAIGAVFKLGLQVGVFKVGCSSLGVQVGVCRSGCCEFLVSIFRWRKPPHHVKVNPLGEVSLIENRIVPLCERVKRESQNSK